MELLLFRGSDLQNNMGVRADGWMGDQYCYTAVTIAFPRVLIVHLQQYIYPMLE